MKKLLILILSVFFTTASFGATANIHYWVIQPSQGWRSVIQLTNTCNADDVDISIQLWKEDGSLLKDKQIAVNKTTDSEGKISLHLSPHQLARLGFEFGYFDTAAFGSGTVTTSYTKPNVECLVGSYSSTEIINNGSSSYGRSYGYLLNNGKKF